MNFGDNIKQIIATVAPTLGVAIGGPLGGAAGTFIANALGVKPGDDKAVSTAILGASPDTLLALKKADLEFQAHLEELGVQKEQLAYADTNSARQREIAVKDHTPAILAYLITMGFFGVLGFMMAHGIPMDSGGEALLVMLGALGTAWAGVVGYYFGSSASSKNKDTLLFHSSPASKD